jgi:hypothetical protein
MRMPFLFPRYLPATHARAFYQKIACHISAVVPDFFDAPSITNFSCRLCQVLPLVHDAMFPAGEDAFGFDEENFERSSDSGREGIGAAVDLVVCVDAPNGGAGTDGVMVMAGFWAARRCNGGSGGVSRNGSIEPRSKSCKFLSDVLSRCQTATEDAHDQHSFNIVLSQYSNRRLISFAFLDTTLFLNGKFSAQFDVIFFNSRMLQGPRISSTWSTCAGDRGDWGVPWQLSKTTGLRELAANCSAFAGTAYGSWTRNRICR